MYLMNWVVSQKMPIFHFIIWRSTQENSPLFSFTCDMVGSYCWINNDVLKNEDDAEIFHNIKSQSVWAICPSTNPFYKWNRIQKIHFIQKFVVNLVLQYFFFFCFQWKKRLFVIGWASQSFFTCSQKPRTMSEFVV